MKFALLVSSTLLSIAHGARYGLLRVGSAVSASGPATAGSDSNQRSLFEEDFSLAFRQLFGYNKGLCMSVMAAPLSMSMAQAQLSMSLAPLSLSMSFGAAGMPFGTMSEQTAYQGSTNVVGTTGEADDPTSQASEANMGNDPPTSARGGMGSGTVAGVAVVGAVLVAALIAKNRQNSVPSSVATASVGSF